MPSVTPEELERRATQKAGVINYLNQKISDLTKKKKNWKSPSEQIRISDIDRRIEEIVEEIESIEAEILSDYRKEAKAAGANLFDFCQAPRSSISAGSL